MWERYSAIDPIDTRNHLYRIAPEPKRVPLGPDDIPPLCWVKAFGSYIMLVVGVGNDGVFVQNGACENMKIIWGELQENCHYSTDRKNWKPCWKEVAQ